MVFSSARLTGADELVGREVVGEPGRGNCFSFNVARMERVEMGGS